jgi:hypothetical protein
MHQPPAEFSIMLCADMEEVSYIQSLAVNELLHLLVQDDAATQHQDSSHISNLAPKFRTRVDNKQRRQGHRSLFYRRLLKLRHKKSEFSC